MLEVINLECRLSERLVFQNLSFILERKETIEIIGSNGSGKTTLLKALVGLIPETNGDIKYNGSILKSLFYSQCFYQGHLLAIKNSLTIFENLKLSFPEYLRTELVNEAIDKVGLISYANRPCADLSVGQFRKVAIAKLILCKRPLYLIDEPFTALDDSSISLVSDLIMDMKSNGSSFILTGHRGSDLADKTLNLDEL